MSKLRKQKPDKINQAFVVEHPKETASHIVLEKKYERDSKKPEKLTKPIRRKEREEKDKD